MFQRGKRNIRTEEEIRAASEAVRYASGNIVVFSHQGTTVGVRLDGYQPYVPPGEVRQYGPADQIGNALADVLKHITGTPPDVVEHDDDDADDDPDEVRYRPVDDPWAAARLERSRADDMAAQLDVIQAIREQLEIWRADVGSQGVVSHSGLDAFLGTLTDRINGGSYVSRSPF